MKPKNQRRFQDESKTPKDGLNFQRQASQSFQDNKKLVKPHGDEKLMQLISLGILSETELYIDITDMPIEQLYPEERLRLLLGYGKGGYIENGKYITF